VGALLCKKEIQIKDFINMQRKGATMKESQIGKRVIGLGLTACVTLAVLAFEGVGNMLYAGKKTKKEPPAPQEIEVSAKLPTVTPLAGTNLSQEKGNVRISVGLVSYKVAIAYVSHAQRTNPKFKEAILLPHNQVDVFVERTCTPTAQVLPSRLEFLVTVGNEMDHVFRGSGMVVRYQVGGKDMAVDQSAWSDLANAIIPPRGSQQVAVYGPTVSTLPSNGTLGLYFDDVVTGTNPAGDVTQRQSFEWYFQLNFQDQNLQAEEPPPDRMFVGPGHPVTPCQAPVPVSNQ
jgi:hypothetical protein